MPSEGDGLLSNRPIRSSLGNLLSLRNAAMLLAGVLAGYSISILGNGPVAVPVVGAVPGLLVGTLGIMVALGVYRWKGGCVDCGDDCGCAGDCGDSCSYDP